MIDSKLVSNPLPLLETLITERFSIIEAWFDKQWQKTTPSITTSVDLRSSGLKLAPVDTNLFPAGFNNLNDKAKLGAVHAIKNIITHHCPKAKKVLILPETHTRNSYYTQSLSTLMNAIVQAGFEVRLGNIDKPAETLIITDNQSVQLTIETLEKNKILCLKDFMPDVIILNNDLSGGMPTILSNNPQIILPNPKLGWNNRLKSQHFSYYNQVAEEFAKICGLDSWLINPYFKAIESVDFMKQEGLDNLVAAVDEILKKIKQCYQIYGVCEIPFVVVKADNGTYGMSVMMIKEAHELYQLNRKQRTRMSATKGSQKVNRVIIQEGISTIEKTATDASAEPVIYLIGSQVIGGFYRGHPNKASNDNLNAPGMYFEPFDSHYEFNSEKQAYGNQQLYAYGVVARLAAVAAARENAEVSKKL